jgi:hypothetical protein
MDTLTLVGVVAVVAVIAYGVYASIQAGRARTSELEALAPTLGLTFIAEPPAISTAAAGTGDPSQAFEALRAAFGDFRRFQGSMRPRLFNVMRGEKNGVTVSLFDYDEGQTTRNTPRTQTLASIDDPALRLPPFSLVPIPGRYVVPVTRATQAMAGLVGSSRHDDAVVAMPAHAGFDDQYLLRGQDEPALRGVFTDRVVRFFAEHPGWIVEGDGTRLLMNRLSAEEVRTYWRGAIAPSDAREIAQAVSAARDGTLGARLLPPAGLPPVEWGGFLAAALDVAAQFRAR